MTHEHAETHPASTASLIDEIKALRDSTDKLFELLEHLWQNRKHLRFEINAVLTVEARENIAETLCCYHCERSFEGAVMQALHDGWIDVRQVAGWDKANYSGWCLECQAVYEEEDFQRHYWRLSKAARKHCEDAVASNPQPNNGSNRDAANIRRK